MSDEAAVVILQEVRRLTEKVDSMGAQLARLSAKVQRPDLVKYSVAEAAERMGRSRSGLYELIRAGEIVPVREKNRTYITEEAVQSWERKQRHQT